MILAHVISVMHSVSTVYCIYVCFFFQAEDGIRDLVRSRGLGDVYKRQSKARSDLGLTAVVMFTPPEGARGSRPGHTVLMYGLSLIHI